MTLQEAQLILNVKEGDTKEHIQAVSSPPLSHLLDRSWFS